MSLLKLPESFGNDVPAKVRVLAVSQDTVALQLDTDCGFAEVELTSAEADQLRQMIFEETKYL